MKYFKKSVIISNNLRVNDHIKIAGVVYRVTRTNWDNDVCDISFENARRPILKGMLTIDQNTLMNVWRPKYL